MLKARGAASRASLEDRSRIGLALAGGGPLGGIYQIGALLALSEALQGIDFSDLDIYVGVSSGSFIAAGLANQLTPAVLYRTFIENAGVEHPLSPEVFLKPAFREYYRGAKAVPQLLLESLWKYASNPLERGVLESFQGLSRAIPTGLFDNTAVGEYLTTLFTSPGRTNDFRKLKHALYLVATELDSGESVEFGAKGYDKVPISRAVQASSALPGLFPPVKINGHYYVDGALKKTLHASVALREGARLVLCINPLVPFDANLAAKKGISRHRKLVDGGLPVVLSQTFRALIHSRMQVGMAKYDTAYKDADVILFEPNADDAEMFFANVFSYANRRRVCDHAYRQTLNELAQREAKLTPILLRHGVRLRREVLHAHRRAQASHLSRAAASVGLKRQLEQSLGDLRAWLHETH